jgi:hypothetical protein
LVRWRNAQVDLMRGRACVGGCPIGSLASELSDTDPLARARLTRAFAQWEDLIRDGLKAIAARGELPSGLDVDRLALAMLAGVQGGVQLSQVRRDTGPLEAAVDAMIDTSAAWGCAREPPVILEWTRQFPSGSLRVVLIISRLEGVAPQAGFVAQPHAGLGRIPGAAGAPSGSAKAGDVLLDAELIDVQGVSVTLDESRAGRP